MNPGRAGDERLLEWLRLRDEGVSAAEIAARYGVTPRAVHLALQKVREADHG